MELLNQVTTSRERRVRLYRTVGTIYNIIDSMLLLLLARVPLSSLLLVIQLSRRAINHQFPGY